jgi:hypothetical protein
MNQRNLLRAAFFSLAAFLVANTPLSAAEPAADKAANPRRMLLDFSERKPDFSYQTWEKDAVGSPQGLVISGRKATGKGGCGSSAVQWDLSKERYLEMAVIVGVDNLLPAFSVMLKDRDGSSQSYRFNVESVAPNQSVRVRAVLSKPSYTGDAGAKPGFDLTDVVEWHVQGDWTTEAKAQLLFRALMASE